MDHFLTVRVPRYNSEGVEGIPKDEVMSINKEGEYQVQTYLPFIKTLLGSNEELTILTSNSTRGISAAEFIRNELPNKTRIITNNLLWSGGDAPRGESLESYAFEKAEKEDLKKLFNLPSLIESDIHFTQIEEDLVSIYAKEARNNLINIIKAGESSKVVLAISHLEIVNWIPEIFLSERFGIERKISGISQDRPYYIDINNPILSSGLLLKEGENYKLSEY